MPGCCEVPLPKISCAPTADVHQINVRDCVRLSATRCTVCEDCRIIPLQHAVQKRLCRGLVYIALHGVLVEYAVESERLVLDTFPLRHDGAGETLNGIIFGRVEYSGVLLAYLMLDGWYVGLCTSTSRP